MLLGADPGVDLSRRAAARIEAVREELAGTVDPAGLVLVDGGAGAVLWTWAGWRANATVIAALGGGAAFVLLAFPPGQGPGSLGTGRYANEAHA